VNFRAVEESLRQPYYACGRSIDVGSYS